jgi:hypothetical protein
VVAAEATIPPSTDLVNMGDTHLAGTTNYLEP